MNDRDRRFITSEAIADEASQIVWDAVQEAFASRDCVGYWRYPLFSQVGEQRREPDILVADRELGLIVITVQESVPDSQDWPAEDLVRQQLQAIMGYCDRESALWRKVNGRAFIALPSISADREGERPSTVPLLFQDQLAPDRLLERLENADAIVPGEGLNEEQWQALLAAISGTSVLRKRPRDRRTNSETRSAVLELLRENLYDLDLQQERIGKEIPPSLQRIRGTAGSGKTILLCQKAAHMHFKHPDWEIALVFFTRSLYDAIVTVVDRWMRRFSNGEVAYDPNKNNKLKVLHAWGAKQQPGFYSTLCAAQGMRPRTPGAVATKQPIKGLAELCKRLLEETAIEPIFDAILIDEGQDFVVEDALKFQDKQPIYWLAYQALRPSDPEHPEQRRLIWAYDEVQSLDSLKIPTAKELFGNDSVWRTALSGAYQGGIQKSEIMRRCYRTPSTILTAAHGIGMGLLRPGGMLSGITRADEWRAIGYEVSGQFRSGQQIVLHRPSETAPNPVEELWGEPVLEFETYSTRQEELEALAANIRDNLEVDRLNPSRDILVIILGTAYDAIELENRTANFLSERGIDIYIPTALHLNEINPKYPQRDPDRFWFDGGVTISRIPRAKGNEADMVYIIGLEQIARNESEVSLRNQLFVALTRARGWVSLSGVGNYEMYREMRQTIDSGNTLTFTYKSPLKRRLDEE